MSVVFQKPYSYSLYVYDNVWYVTYLSGGPLESGVSIRLNSDEISLVHDNQTELEKLIKKFKKEPSLYAGREISPVVTSNGPPAKNN
ncbi:hypothetical protein CWC02_14265 [Pseudoalteromonas sp. S2721]|uniref:hypothetical protein n=1 Tax=Pseudoalteromonas sp. S2721 TaxID=579526 RepID=UPI00110A6C32|nr:hypothetical protein [Pseudoalteromonas sp. S2721]TMP16324.1 hypothetical protein CWC02_14265 [Pseudoalteromonas sp. S2721]